MRSTSSCVFDQNFLDWTGSVLVFSQTRLNGYPDDLIGNAIEDTVVGEFHSGSNWMVRGENNVTNGWLKLQMR